jgi:hypothetical protein
MAIHAACSAHDDAALRERRSTPIGRSVGRALVVIITPTARSGLVVHRCAVGVARPMHPSRWHRRHHAARWRPAQPCHSPVKTCAEQALFWVVHTKIVATTHPHLTVPMTKTEKSARRPFNCCNYVTNCNPPAQRMFFRRALPPFASNLSCLKFAANGVLCGWQV